MSEILMGAMLIALLVIVALLAVILTRINVKVKNYYDTLGQAIDHMSAKAFEREQRKIAKRYVELDRIAKWIEDLGQSGELDIAHLATETDRRAYVLALKKAEDCLIVAEDDLDRIRRKISSAQKEIAEMATAPHIVKTNRRALNALLEQEAIAKKRVKVASKRLSKLTKPFKADSDTPDIEDVTLPEEDDHGISMVVLPETVVPVLPETITPIFPIDEDTLSPQPNDQPEA